ncbi:MAG: hypothetical protein JXN64_03115 [Spirochaetes bacterium]|nr:hypothetical protein [Spirochaetota bacterium]
MKPDCTTQVQGVAETAYIILIESNHWNASCPILFGRAIYRKMIQNLILAAGYNVSAIPLAAGVSCQAGIIIPPVAGAVFMSQSTAIVAINARLLKLK